jgi:TolB-like protein
MDKVAPKNSRSSFSLDSASAVLPPPRPDAVLKHLEKMLLSPTLSRSKKLCQFLRFTVDQVLQGHGSELKEYAIAVSVFRRAREFDPGADPIVRVQARRLRAKLERYYQADGRDEPIRIDYPVGSYSPVFSRRIVAQGAPAPPAERGAVPNFKQIAVLPFLSVGPEDCQSFSDGLTEDLMHTLSTCPGVRIVARASCSEFKSLSLDARTIAERLGVSALVTGSVRLEEGRLRVMAQVVDSETGVNVWSGVYDRELAGILATQSRISRELAEAIESRLGPAAIRIASV